MRDHVAHTFMSQPHREYLALTMSTVVFCPLAAMRLHLTLVVKTRRQLPGSPSTTRHCLLKFRELRNSQTVYTERPLHGKITLTTGADFITHLKFIIFPDKRLHLVGQLDPTAIV